MSPEPDQFDQALLSFCQTYQHYGSHVSALLTAFQEGVSHQELDVLQQHASQIGANRLLAKCRKLNDFASDEERIAGTAELARELDSTVKKAVASLIVLNAEKGADEDSLSISAQLGDIIQLLDDYDAGAGDALQDLYDNYQQSEHRWVLRQAIQKVSQYDFEAAGELLRPLMTQTDISDLQ